jgi:hypothetical protein
MSECPMCGSILCAIPDCDRPWNGISTHQMCQQHYDDWCSKYFPTKDSRDPIAVVDDDEAGTTLEVYERVGCDPFAKFPEISHIKHKKGEEE